MNKNELRVGNIVSVEAEIVTVESIYEVGINLEIQSGYYGSWECEYDGVFNTSLFRPNMLILPIKLSGEWLLKLGFSERPHLNDWYKSISDSNTILFIRNGEYGICAENSRPAIIGHCNYVHQLQNLFYSLTGEELYII